MTTYTTWGTLRGEVERECDIEDQNFITAQELIDAANDAIDKCEKQILTIYEDYLLTSAPLTFVSGQKNYALPDDIFAHKIRGIVYTNGTVVYEIKPMNSWKKFLEYALNNADSVQGGTSWPYKFFIKNATAGAPEMIISPTPQESGALAEVWYIREANRIVDDTSIIDLPDADQVIKLALKMKVHEKEGNPLYPMTATLHEEAEKELVDTLTGMIPDADVNIIEADLSFYGEHN